MSFAGYYPNYFETAGITHEDKVFFLFHNASIIINGKIINTKNTNAIIETIITFFHLDLLGSVGFSESFKIIRSLIVVLSA